MIRAGRIGDGEAPETTATRYWIPSGGNFLDSLLIEPAGSASKGGVLICHGIGETVEHWRAVQRLLAKNDVCSLVFDYSGYGRSSGRVNAAQCERDALEAFRYLQRVRPAGGVWVLGYSMGSGVAAAMVSEVPARGLIVCAGFSSLRKAARRCGLPDFLVGLLPDIWDNEEALRSVAVPVLILHGAEDRLFPASVAVGLARCCGATCELVVVPGVAHDGPIYAPKMTFWGEVIGRV
jgi:pimeloyl-ACP methyl ester carboxylesterase